MNEKAIFQTSYLGSQIRVFSNRVEFRKTSFAGVTSVPINQIASVELPMSGVWKITIRTTGRKKYTIPATENKKVRESVHRVMGGGQPNSGDTQSNRVPLEGLVSDNYNEESGRKEGHKSLIRTLRYLFGVLFILGGILSPFQTFSLLGIGLGVIYVLLGILLYPHLWEKLVEKGKLPKLGRTQKILLFIILTLFAPVLIGSVSMGREERPKEEQAVREKALERTDPIEKEVPKEVAKAVATKEEKGEKEAKQKYPRLAEETMDRDFFLSCEGGDEVVLWNLPTGIEQGQKNGGRVPCGTAGYAYNEFYNDELDITFYAVQMWDERVDTKTYGWVTGDLLFWRD